MKIKDLLLRSSVQESINIYSECPPKLLKTFTGCNVKCRGGGEATFGNGFVRPYVRSILQIACGIGALVNLKVQSILLQSFFFDNGKTY